VEATDKGLTVIDEYHLYSVSVALHLLSTRD
jgi:hypothetical protein